MRRGKLRWPVERKNRVDAKVIFQLVSLLCIHKTEILICAYLYGNCEDGMNTHEVLKTMLSTK